MKQSDRLVNKYSSLLQEIPPLAKAIATKFGALPQVVAVVLAGYRTTGVSNEARTYALTKLTGYG